jgi:ubiquitin-hydrolase Zn-finger-containing protein
LDARDPLAVPADLRAAQVAAQRGRAHLRPASYGWPMSSAIPGIDPTVPPSGTGCLECDATGGWWVHLRRCIQCGHIGCCDDSLSKHASGHAGSSGHPYIRSFEPGEDWIWNYRTNQYYDYDGPKLADPQHRPMNQSVPGPAERLPKNWQQLLD